MARKFAVLQDVECDSSVTTFRCPQWSFANLLNPAARVRIGNYGNERHDIRYHRSTMVLGGRDSAPAAALSGSLFLKPPALPDDTY
jgi:hypothetical protein